MTKLWHISKEEHFPLILYKLTQDIESVADDSSVKHYKESEGNVPPWIYAKALSFG
ncbi:hypothetical protein GKC33_12995, partial [Lactobacillus salivarius]|nr:hypothetical protein [Ligilactobacillus salivarius]